MKYSFGVSDFLEEISSLSHSVVFLYFFALITEEGFLISPWYSLELCIQKGVSFLFSFVFHFPFFTAICKTSSDSHFAFLHFYNHRQLANLITWTTALFNSVKLSHAMWGHPRWMDHGGEIWQNVVHWRMEWQTTSVFLPWELHEQYEKTKRYDTERWTPQVSRCPICYWRSD